jgi:hypothetical protein
MSRYVVGRPRVGEDYYDRPMHQLGHPTVFVQEPANTGLLDPDGNPIFKIADPIGFVQK